MLKLTFLGTSSGVPTIRRNVTALALHTTMNRDWWLVDCGEATQHQLLRIPLTVHDLAGICVTHIHGDHSYGLPGLLASASMNGRKKPLILIAPAPVKAWLDATMLHTELFLTFEIIHIDVASEQSVYQQDGLTIERFPLSHRAPSFGFKFSFEKTTWKVDSEALRARGVPPGPAWGQLQHGKDVHMDDGTVLAAARYRSQHTERATAVIGGDNDTPSLLAKACQHADVLVHEATYTEAVLQKVGPGPQHSSVQRTASFAADAQIPNLVLTHFSARYDSLEGMAEVAAEARRHYSGTLFLAQDFNTYELSNGALAKLPPAPRAK
ncbi:ribonuclease Z [Duganella sp. Root336D2]|uniref:ribonuclease Z n=1 Tax=Duganella sp. Root336D2 TaxID=1736518 RepID=UPI0006FBF979|nr:ribonuclease Z [Duganella sp. Root336D2]KQV61414.1 MBL fold metallo-hydrolase [Duganella sp. Root336D2]